MEAAQGQWKCQTHLQNSGREWAFIPMAGKHSGNMPQGSLKELYLLQRKGLSRREDIILTFPYPPPNELMAISLSNNFSRKVNPPHILGVLEPDLELAKIRLHWKSPHNSRVRVGPMGARVKKVSAQVWSDSQGNNGVQRT